MNHVHTIRFDLLIIGYLIMNRIYIGPKKRTIEYSSFFDYSITIVGYGIDNKAYSKVLTFEYWNPDNELIEIDIYNKGMAGIDYSAEIMAHNPRLLFKCDIPKNLKWICKNPQNLLDLVDNKFEARDILKNIVPILDYTNIKGQDFDYEKLSKEISKNLVVQLPTGSGGSKTFLVNKSGNSDFLNIIEPDKEYSVSAYIDHNIPYNVHCVIGNNQIRVFLPSMQILEITNKIEYIGSEYNVYIDKKVNEKIEEYSIEICKKLMELGYLGVLGIDYILCEGNLFFIEINPRFQGSTSELDKILIKNGLPSIFEYNYMAFNGIDMPEVKGLKLVV